VIFSVWGWKFNSRENYRVATLANYDLKLGETGFVFCSVWPKAEAGSQASRLFTAGRIFSKEKGAILFRGEGHLSRIFGGYELFYTNITYGGMSGGPVLDMRGRVIGIHGMVDGEPVGEQAGLPKGFIQLGYSLGVPVRTFVNWAKEVGEDPGWLRVGKDAPPVLTAEEQRSIVESLIKNIAAPGKDANALAWVNYGNQLWRLRKNDEALAAFDRAIQIQPAFYQAWFALGLTLDSLDRYEEAIAAFDRAIRESQEKFAPAWRGRGDALDSLKRYEEALVCFDKAIALDPDNFVLHQLRGQALKELKRHQEAIAAYNKAIELKPEFAFAYMLRSISSRALGDFQGAIADCNKAIELQPDSAEAYMFRGFARRALGDFQGAIADFNKAIEIQPDYADVIRTPL
jgi:Flp pilus assembly protein TadD